MNPVAVQAAEAGLEPNIISVQRLMQFGQTQRYHTEVLIKSQDVAQHSFYVAWLCWLLSGRSPSGELIMTALAHDAGERSTGDLPAPTKRATKLGPQFDALEAVYTGGAGFLQPTLTQDEHEILKLADAMEGAFYCLRELKMGNRLLTSRFFGGAALNFMDYVQERLNAVKNRSTWRVGNELFVYLQEQYELYSK